MGNKRVVFATDAGNQRIGEEGATKKTWYILRSKSPTGDIATRIE